MNLKTTPFLFGLLLTILFLFGLMLVYKKNPVDENLIMTTMQADADIDTLRFVYQNKDKEAEELAFVKENELWYLQQSGKKAKIEGFRVDDMVRSIKNARVNEDEKVQTDTRDFDLPPGKPRVTITLSGKVKNIDKKWEFFVGREGAGGAFVYVSSSDRASRAFPVSKQAIESVLFKDTATLRSKRLFDLVEPTVTALSITEGDKELTVKKTEDIWRFVKPDTLAGSFADFPGASEDPFPKKDPFKDKEIKEIKPKSSGGVKDLIIAIAGIHVDEEKDFEPLGKELDEKSATMRLELASGTEKVEKAEKDDKDKGKKEEKITREVLIVGKKAPPPAATKKGEKVEEQYYAKMKGDDGVFRISAKQLEAIKKAVADPSAIRSSDVVMFDTSKADAVIIKSTHVHKDDKGKDVTDTEETKLLRPDDKEWQVAQDKNKFRKGSDKGIIALLDSLQGKRAIETFGDGKDDAWAGLKDGADKTEVAIYLGGVDKEKKDEKKKDEKKADKDKKDKKDEKKDEPPATLKDKAKPYVTITIGTIDKAKKIAYVKRELQSGKPSYFTVPESYVESLKLEQGSLAFIDPSLPKVDEHDIAAIELQRGKEKTELDRIFDDKFLKVRYTLKDANDATGIKQADPTKVIMLTLPLTRLQAKKWVKIDDADKLGLKDPQTIVTIYTRKEDAMGAAGGASLIGLSAGRMSGVLLPAFGTTLATRIEDKDKKVLGEKVTIKFGKEIEEDKVKMVYAEFSGIDLAFLVPADVVKSIKEADLRDRSAVGFSQAQINATLLGIASSPPIDMTPLASPLVTGVIHQFDPAKAKAVHVTIRTPFELRSFKFAAQAAEPAAPSKGEKGKDTETGKDEKAKGKDDKGKGKDEKATDKKDEKAPDKKDEKPKVTWVDQSGIPEFQVDSDKVAQLVEQVAKLKTDRFASFAGPTADSKATDKDFKVRIEVTFEGAAVILTVGTHFGQLGYYAHSTAWPDAVFFLPMGTVDPWLRGTDYFGKERVAVGE